MAPLGNASEGRRPVSQHPQISPIDPRPPSGATRPADQVNANPAHWSTAAIAETAVAVALAAVCHSLSGTIFFGSCAPAGQAVWIYSLTYNLLYLAPEAVLTAVLLALLVVAYDEAGVARGGRLPQ